MSKIRLFNPTDTDYSTHGLGGIDAISATVTEELNGSYEMELTYPITGELFSQIGMRSILYCKPNPFDSPEPFRVYKKTDPINGISTIYARHRSYDASGVAIEPFIASNVQDALSGFKTHAVNSNEFTFSTDKTTTSTFKVEKPSTIRSMMGGTQGSIIDVYGGEYEYHNTEIYLKNHRGSDNGVVIEYGKNLTDLNQDKECSSVYTGLYPYFYSEADGTFQLAEKIVNASGSYSFSKILPLDLSDKFSAKPTEEQLRSAAQSYIENNHIGVPKVSIDIKYVDLSDDPTIGAFESVRLGDTVTVKFKEMGVSATAKVIKTSYNVLESRYSEATIGDARSTLDATIVDIKKAAEEKPSATFLETAIANATALLSGITGGHYILWNNQTKKPENPNEFIITEYAPGDPDHNYLISGHIWRFNLAGWGHSDAGYNGSYSMAATLDGGFVADFITSGVIRALSIIAPQIKSDESTDPKFSLNGSSGEIKGSTIISPEIKNSETNASLLINNTGFYTSGSLKNGTFSRTEIKSGIINIYNNLTQFTNSDDGGKKSVYIGSGTNTSGDKSAGIIQLLNGGSLWIYDLQNEKYALIEGTNISIDRVNGHAPVLASDVSLSHQYMLQWYGSKLNFIVDNTVVKSI